MGEREPTIQDLNLPQEYTWEQIDAYQRELSEFLERMELALTHYETLGLDYVATTGEIKLAYMKRVAMLNPALYNLNLPQPEDLLADIDAAFEKVSTAFSVLVNFKRRAEYDDLLFEREEISSDLPARKNSQPAVVKELETEAEPSGEDFVERRRHQRFELKLPVRVTGYHQTRGKCQEIAQSYDVSICGALLKLTMPVRRGMIVQLSMPMPMTLRSHGFFEDHYEVYGIVRRIVRNEDEAKLIGLEFIGEEAPEAWSEKPWGIFQVESLGDEERRRATRKRVMKSIHIEYLDKDMNLLAKEEAITEDVSRQGMRVCVKKAPEALFMVKVESLSGNFEGYADVITRYQGEDNMERLCLAFLAQNS